MRLIIRLLAEFGDLGEAMHLSDARDALAEALVQFIEFTVQTFGKMAAKLREVFANERDFFQPAVNVDAEQLPKVFLPNVQALSIEVGPLRKHADWSFDRVSGAGAAFEDPLQHATVLSVAGPQKFSILGGAEPIDVINSGKLRALARSNFQVVREVITHVVAAEGKHSHRVAAELAHLSGGCGGGFAADGCAQERSMLPVEGFGNKWHDARAPAAEEDRIDRHALLVFPLRRDDRALPRWR